MLKSNWAKFVLRCTIYSIFQQKHASEDDAEHKTSVSDTLREAEKQVAEAKRHIDEAEKQAKIICEERRKTVDLLERIYQKVNCFVFLQINWAGTPQLTKHKGLSQ